ncbi:MAG: 1A family penicillin-binding protein [Candidatus Peregrinibacteria bacterium Greene0416_19]|nr:MAG: 1A family penicillin-binding protein [Candidatus Peregrinibacteria bacterium Greene0416_19]
MIRKNPHLLWLPPILLLVSILLWPLPGRVRSPQIREPLRLLDRRGRLLYEVRHRENGAQSHLSLSQVPMHLRQALIEVEDRTFRSHRGVSMRGTTRAMWQNLTQGRVISGGSTITQQLVRIRLGTGRRGYIRKVREMLLALKLEGVLSKDEILEAYLNEAYFGHQAYGIAEAARIYLGKNPAELSLAESSFLIGLLQSPSAYDPFRDPTRARRRHKTVLQTLADRGIVTEEEREEMGRTPLRLAPDRLPIAAPHFVFWLLQERGDDLQAGTDVTTTLDLDLQRQAERIVSGHLETLREQSVTAAAVVVLDARSGDVLAMVGSADYFDAAHDGAVNVAVAPRQPGSAIKPLTYALALARGDTAATTVADVETRFFTQEGNPYTPRNYDYGYHGLVRYREALANSYNVAAVRVLERVGVGNLISFLRQTGITTITETPEHYGLALTLGDAEVPLLELAAAYGIFARQGRTLPLRTLATDPVRQGSAILDPRVAWLIADILSDPSARLAQFGGQSPLAFDFPVAAKTGTTRNARDNWTVGFTPDVIVGVWVGNADNTPMKNTSGVTGAGPIFHDVLLAATSGKRTPFFRPHGIIDGSVCRLSGKLPTPLCPHTVNEHFIAGTEPRDTDDIYRSIRIDRRNNLLAGPGCGDDVTEERTFTVFPPDVRRWARENDWPVPPETHSPLCRTASSSAPAWSLIITKPADGDSFEIDPLIPIQLQAITLEARADQPVETIEWFVDSERIGVGRSPDFRLRWQPRPGRFLIEARSPSSSATVTVEIRRRGP